MKALTTGLAAALALGLGVSAATAADVTLRLHTLVKSPHPYNDMAAFMKEEIEAKSEGAIEVKIFDSGQLGKDPAVIGEMALGTIDLMISSTNNAAKQVPEYQIFSMPYLFADFEELMAKVGPGTEAEAYFQKVYADRGVGMRLLALGGSGTRNLSNARGPVEKVADIEGFKMRTPPSPMISKTWEALGTLPVSIAWGELYAGIQTGVAEALESSIPGYTGSKLYEVAPYLALTAHTIQVNHLSVSEVSWNKLSAEQQALLTETAAAAAAHGVEKAKGYESELVELLKSEHGVTVTEPDKAEFQAVLKPVQPKLAEELGLTEPMAVIAGN